MPKPDKPIDKPAVAATATAAPQKPLKPVRRKRTRFPIVAIGASAGGLEALTAFMENTPADSGMGFVVLQHIDPDRPDMMPELLHRHTEMPVCHADNHMNVAPNHVYVLPPNKDLSILHGKLYLLDPTEKHGSRLPIDFFFRALAADQQEYSVGVILSGMGSDGSLGLRAIKERAGLSLAQDPASAAFSGMPMSAINAGLADIVATANELPGRICAYYKDVPILSVRRPAPPPATSGEDAWLEKIMILLRERSGNDFSLYKRTTLLRRIERRMALNQLDALATYVQYLRESPAELDVLFDDLLIGVTSFFRDPLVWQSLQNQAIPALLAEHPKGKALRAWVAGCSTGEEAYSLAMSFRECIAHLAPAGHFTLQIFATDIDEAAIEQARSAIYSANIAADVSPERLTRYFIEEDKCYRVKPDIREMVIFATQNIISDPPFTKLDLLVCRNLLIYLSAGLQRKLFHLFHHALNYHGILMLGSAEGGENYSSLFAPVDSKARIFRRIERPLTHLDFIDMEAPATATSKRPLLQTVRRPNLPARRTAASEKPINATNLRRQMEQALQENKKLREEANTAHEEITAANEELQSANEELQSMNEELTISREELQSLNEELRVINAELLSKVTELSTLTSDLTNLLDSTELATIFLDTDLNIRRYTPFATRLFKLLPVDMGRPLSHIVSDIGYPQLLDDAAAVLRSLVRSEKSASNSTGQSFNVRIMPYRSISNVIDGVVITFTDITEAYAQRGVLLNAVQLLEHDLPAARQAPDPASALEILLGKLQLNLERGLSPPPEIRPDQGAVKNGGPMRTLLPHRKSHSKPHPKPINEASS